MHLPDLDAILSSDLPCSERMVLVVIASYANCPGAEVWPSMKTIAQKAGVHETTAVRCVANLKTMGWLKAKRRFSKSTIYQLSPIASTSTTPVLAPDHASTSTVHVSVLAQCNSNHPLEPSNEPSNDQTLPDDHWFNEFWNEYGKKVGRDKALKIWKRLPMTVRGRIRDRLPAYIKSTPDLKYRKHPATYLNGKHWEDEIDGADEAEPPYGSPEYWNYHAARIVVK